MPGSASGTCIVSHPSLMVGSAQNLPLPVMCFFRNVDIASLYEMTALSTGVDLDSIFFTV